MYLHWLLLLRLILFPWERYTCNFQLTAGLEAIISPCLDGTLGGTEEPDSGALRTAMLSSFSCYIEEFKCLMLAHIKYFILKLLNILCDHIVTYQMQYIILLLFADYPHFHLWIAMSLDCRS